MEWPEPRTRSPANYRRFTALVGRALLVRVLVLAVLRYHVDPRVEVHRIDALSAVYGVLAHIVVSLDHVVAGTSAHRIDAVVVGAYEVRSTIAEHTVVAEAAPNLVGATIARDRVVAPVPADAVYAARAREVVVAATASYVVGAVGADEGVRPGGAVEGSGQGHPACQEHRYSNRSDQQSYSPHFPPFSVRRRPHP